MAEVLHPPGFVPLDFKPDSSSLFCQRGKHVVRSMVTNTIVNMEHVLSDLNGIMGDIQSLVAQIDSVTARIDHTCGREEARASRRQGNAPQSDGPDRPSLRSDVNNPERSGSRKDESTGEGVRNLNRSPRHSIGSNRFGQPVAQASVAPMLGSSKVEARFNCGVGEKPKGHTSVKEWFFKRSTRNSMPVDLQGHDIVASGDYNLKTQKARIQVFQSQEECARLQHIPNTSSQSGGIAIVHPTVFSNPQPSNDVVDLKASTLETSSKIDESFIQKYSAIQSTDVFERSPEMFRKDSNAFKKLQVYNAYYQPITPTDHTSSSEKKAVKVPECSPAQRRWSNNEIVPPSPFRLRRSCMGSLPNSPRHQRTLERARLNPHFSPSLGRSLAKHVYAKIDGSLSSSTSSGLMGKSMTQNYYYSIDSDLDSDIVVGFSADGRSITPDIDWSYLNLVGDDDINTSCDFTVENLACNDNDAYEIPVVPKFITGKPFEMLQSSPDVVARLPIYQIMRQQNVTVTSPSRCVESENAECEKLYERPVVSHVFCEEVVSDMTTGYCGCYEAVLDAVLENIAGYETFEEAVLNFDNDEIVAETYINFDDDFEWDVGLSPEEQYDFEINSPLICVQEFSDAELSEDIFSFLQEDTSEDSISSGKPSPLLNRPQDLAIKQRINNAYIESKSLCVQSPQSNSNNKRKLSPQMPITQDKVSFGAMENMSSYHTKGWNRKPLSKLPLYLQMSPIYSSNNTPCTESSEDHDLANAMTLSSDDTSCQAVCTGSPMSLSSSEAPFTSPDTDRLMTSSEADDLFTSHDENYFLSPVGTPKTPGDAPRKTNARILRQEFFKTLCKVCDENEEENNKTDQETAEDYGNANNFRTQNKTETISDTGSTNGDGISPYNRHVNTWKAYALVDVQADDVSDSASDILNDNALISSMTSSYIDADNLSSAPESQSVLW